MPAVIPLIIAGVGYGIDAWGKHKAGKAARKMADLQADALLLQHGGDGGFGAALGEIQAKDAIARGAQEESKFRQGVRGLIGSQRAGFAAGNIDVSYGSAVDVQAESAFMGELDALTIRTNAAREAWGYRVQGSASGGDPGAGSRAAEAAMLRLQGKQSAIQSRYAIAGTLLGFGASLYNTSRRGGGSGPKR